MKLIQLIIEYVLKSLSALNHHLHQH